MTHLISVASAGFYPLSNDRSIYVSFVEDDFQVKDDVIVQDGRTEHHFSVDSIIETPYLKKNTVLVNLSKKEI